MHAIYELKEMLCKELDEYGAKGELSAGTLDIVDKLAHTIKNLDKIIESMEEEEYSNYGGGSYQGENYGGMPGRSYRRSMSSGSYARGRGSYARRDSRGRYSSRGYSRNADLADQLREMMQDAPDENTRMEIQRLADKLDQ